MKKCIAAATLASLLVCACGEDSGTNGISATSGGNGFILPEDCVPALNKLPVPPTFEYVTSFDEYEKSCIVEITSPVDENTIPLFFDSQALADDEHVHYYANLDYMKYKNGLYIELWSAGDRVFHMEVRDCPNAAKYAGVPEQNQLWENVDGVCEMVDEEGRDVTLHMTQQEWLQKEQTIQNMGWNPSVGCEDRLDISYHNDVFSCYQKKVGDVLFELGYGTSFDDMVLEVKVGLDYQKIK